MIPVSPTLDAHRSPPRSRLEVLDGAGHFPHLDDPQRFGRVLLDLHAGTTGARTDPGAPRRRPRARAPT